MNASRVQPVHLKVFVSSPGDVSEERRIALDVLSRLPRKPLLSGNLTIEPVAWDDPEAPVPLTAGETPQHDVNRLKGKPSECDVTIVILWRRLGTPLATPIRTPGDTHDSGTVWEYEDALRARREVLVYHRTGEPSAKLEDPDPEEGRIQHRAVESFLERFRNPDGSFRGGYNEYEKPESFGPLLEKHLEAILRDRIEAQQWAGLLARAERHWAWVVAVGLVLVAVGLVLFRLRPSIYDKLREQWRDIPPIGREALCGPAEPCTLRSGCYCELVADFDGDGKPDLVLVGSSRVFLHSGTVSRGYNRASVALRYNTDAYKDYVPESQARQDHQGLDLAFVGKEWRFLHRRDGAGFRGIEGREHFPVSK